MCSIKKMFLKISHYACNFIKKETLAQVFSCEFCAISKNTFFTEQLRTAVSTKNLKFEKAAKIFSNAYVCMPLRSSHQRCSVRKSVLRNFAKFTGKHLCQNLFFNKVADLACNFIKKENLAQVFSSEFCEISKNTFFTEHLLTTASCPYI